MDKDDVDDLHIVIESLRNSYSLLVSALPTFLGQCLQFREEPSIDDGQTRLFWSALGVPPDMIDEMVRINPWCEGDVLWVAQ
eukprot:8943879-Lingulodinium_polyedra.AAC.1